MGHRLNEKRVLVIGGAKYLGKAVAQAAADEGAVVVLGARDEKLAWSVVAELGGDHAQEHSAIHLDVADEPSILAAAQSLGEVDHVVITASAHHNVPVADLEHDGILNAIEAKIIGPMLVAKHLAPRMPSTGSFLLFSGTAAWNPSPGLTVMGVSNGAVSFIASQLAHELAPLRVNAISPGITDSGTWDGLDEQDRTGMYDSAAAGSLAGRVGSTGDIADAAVWLLAADYVSGETIHVDGGSRHA